MDKPVIKGDTIVVPSDQKFLTDVDMFVEGLLRGWSASESVIADIAISVSELVNNAIFHGNRAAGETPVEVNVTRQDNQAIITVRDRGTGFNPDEVDDPISDENLLKDVGRGIFIVRSLMDEVDIEPSEDGTTVTIRKTIK